MANPRDHEADLDIFKQLAALLTDMGMSDLFQVGERTDNQNKKHIIPSGWLWDQIVNGTVDDLSSMTLAVESTAAFDREYGVIKALRLQSQTDPSVHIPSMKDVRDYRHDAAEMMQRAGLPSFMYDNKLDFDELMKKGLSLIEIEERVGQAWSRVQNTDPLVRTAMERLLGVQGDAALASAYLDPDRTMNSIERLSRTAYTQGMGLRMGVGIDAATADRIAGSPSTDAGIYQDLQTLGTMTGLFAETLSESDDLTANTEGVDSVFFGSAEAQRKLEGRTIERRSANSAVAGGAARTNKGLIGAGIAKN